MTFSPPPEARSEGPWRRRALALATLASLLLPLALAYPLALARIPHERAEIERVLAAYTGLDLRFATLELAWGWEGPEAVFSQVELAGTSRARLRLRAARLVISFSSWASLRRGELAISRVALVAPDIELLPGAPGSGPAPAAAPLSAPATLVLQGLELLPLGRLEIEGGTLRLPPRPGEPAGLVLGLGRATLSRSPGQLTGDARLELPVRFGRALEVSLRLEGELRQRATLHGSARIVAEQLVVGQLEAVLDGARLVSDAGIADVRATLRFANGALRRGAAEFVVDGPAWPCGGPAGQTLRWRRLAGGLRLEQDATSRLELERLEFAPEDGSAVMRGGRAEFLWRGAAPGVSGEVDGIPAAAVPLALARATGAGCGSVPAVELGGVVRRLRFAIDPARESGARWRLSGAIEGLALHTAAGLELAGVDADVDGGEAGLEIALRSAGASVGFGVAPALTGLGVAGTVRWRADRSGWRLETERLQLNGAMGQAWVSGGLVGAQPTRARLTLAVELPQGTVAPLRAGLLGDVGSGWGSLAPQLVSGRLTDLHVELRGSLGLRGESVQIDSHGQGRFAEVELARTGRFPGAADLAGRVGWVSHAGVTTLSAALASGRLALPGGDALTDLQGRITVARGAVRPARLRGHWLGGPVELRLRPDHGRRGGFTVAATGVAEATQLAARLGLAVPGLLEGRATWRAQVEAAEGARPGASGPWHLELDSSLVGLASRLPAPLAKLADTALPLHLSLADDGAAEERLAVQLGGAARAMLRLVGPGSAPVLERGSIRFDGKAARLPEAPRLELSGALPHLELAELAALVDPSALTTHPALDAELDIGLLTIGGQRFAGVRMTLRRDALLTRIGLAADDLAGEFEWPTDPQAQIPARLMLERLRLAGELDPRLLVGAALALPAHGATLEIGDFEWDALRFGHVLAVASMEGGELKLERVRGERPDYTLTAAGACALTPRPGLSACRAHLELVSRDAAGTLRDFGFREEVSARAGRLNADVAWTPATLRTVAEGSSDWLASLSGEVQLELEEGQIAALPSRDSFALFALLPLYANAVEHAPLAPGAGAAPAFERLSGRFELANGIATISDLRLRAADHEVLGRGRIDLAHRRYDQELLVARGADRLPEPVQRFGAGPHVAAAWLALREALRSAADADAAPQAFHLEGSFEAPRLEVQGADLTPD